MKLEEIDALTGATITTTAVITAIQEIADTVNGAPAEGPAAEEAAAEPATEEAAAEPAAEAPAAEEVAEEPAAEEAAAGTTYEATAQGFASPVKVSLTLDEKGTITAITIGDENFAETVGLGARALEESFQSQFIGKTVPVKLEEIDALTAATITTTAVITAIQEIADQIH